MRVGYQDLKKVSVGDDAREWGRVVGGEEGVRHSFRVRLREEGKGHERLQRRGEALIERRVEAVSCREG